MRILTLNYEYPPLGGGGGVAAENLVREFVRLGHDVDVVTTGFADAPRIASEQGARVFREPVWNRDDRETASIPSMLSYPPVAIRRGWKLARLQAYDVIHTHFAIPTGPAGTALAQWLGLPNILSVYGGDIYDPSKAYSPHAHPVLRRVVRSVLNRADVVIPESTELAARTADIYAARTPIEVIPLVFREPPAFERCSRKDLGLHEDRTYAISVSRLVPRKAHGDLLRALAVADREDLELLMLGSGPEEDRLRRLARELGISEKVHFLGFQDEVRKYQYLDAADFFVLASLHEGYGIVFQEAMHCGLPIVTTNVGGQVDFLEHEVNALLSSPREPDALAANLEKMAADQALREKMGQANRVAIAAHSASDIAGRYLALFDRLRDARR